MAPWETEQLRPEQIRPEMPDYTNASEAKLFNFSGLAKLRIRGVRIWRYEIVEEETYYGSWIVYGLQSQASQNVNSSPTPRACATLLSCWESSATGSGFGGSARGRAAVVLKYWSSQRLLHFFSAEAANVCPKYLCPSWFQHRVSSKNKFHS